jgi:tRNA pseudouridine55 synthase
MGQVRRAVDRFGEGGYGRPVKAEIDGVLVVDKPAGPTSFDVVEQVRHVRGARKAGHTGTLDPMATGVLPVCLGEATKIVQFLQGGDKVYRAEVLLGVQTDTQDATGRVVREREVNVERARLDEVAASFVGRIQQVPPMHSALHHEGKRLHELARAGIEVDRPAREVAIHRLQIQDFDGRRLTMEVACSKGTYIRTLAADLGERLGCGAHLTALRRLAAFPFTLDQAVTPDRAAEESLIPPSAALSFLPCIALSTDQAARLRAGARPPDSLAAGHAGWVRLEAPDGELVAVADAAGQALRLLRVLRPAST